MAPNALRAILLSYVLAFIAMIGNFSEADRRNTTNQQQMLKIIMVVYNLNELFLAVQDSSITDIVCRSLVWSEPTKNQSLESIK